MKVNLTTLNETGLILSCDSNIEFPYATAEDVVTVLAKTLAGALYVTRQARGSETACSIQLAMPNVGKENIEFVYIFATSADGKKASNSVFVEVN